MFNFFQKNKVNIQSIGLSLENFELKQNSSDFVQWINEKEVVSLSVNFFKVKPDIPTIKNVEVLQQFYRDAILKSNGGVLEVNLVNLKGLTAVKTLFKLPQQPTGMVYLGSYTIPFKNHSYVIKIQAPETGTTGMRESIVSTRLMKSGDIKMGSDGFEGWTKDPYDENFTKGALMNLSEAPEYDDDFPHHPLSKTRKFLKEVENNIRFDEEVQQLKSFPY